MPVRAAAAAICGAVVRHSIYSVALVLLFSSLHSICFFFTPAVGSGALPAGVELLVLTLTISSRASPDEAVSYLDSCSKWSHT
ncbi:hypothetical protein CCMA1212_000777 [Trichoderma ghanense]|uniref:Secreted protein n=1 Tax=Trichoderma ghanense TaxID=65468 RepID=A0ABY2HHH4_9HYPO